MFRVQVRPGVVGFPSNQVLSTIIKLVDYTYNIFKILDIRYFLRLSITEFEADKRRWIGHLIKWYGLYIFCRFGMSERGGGKHLAGFLLD